MSTTTSKAVALKYAKSENPLLFKYKASGMSKGCSIRFLSVYPLEEEVLYPPLTYLKPSGAPQLVRQEDGTMVKEIQVEPQF